MGTVLQARLPKAHAYVQRIVRRFAHRPDLVAVMDDWVSSEACSSFVLGDGDYAISLISIAIEALENLRLSPERADVRSTLNWLRWCLAHFQQTQPAISSELGIAEDYCESTDLKSILRGIADQVFRDEYWLSSGAAQVDAQATRRALFPNLLSDAFTPTGHYIAASSASKHLLPYPQELYRLCKDSRLLVTCSRLLNSLEQGALSTATVREAVQVKRRIEGAMLDTVVDHLAEPALSQSRLRLLNG